MNLHATYKKHTLKFLIPAGTSRSIYTTKDGWFIFITDNENTGIGECSVLKDLSIDSSPDFEEKLKKVLTDLNHDNLDFDTGLNDLPSIKFGIETATRDLYFGGKRIIYPTDFTEGKEGIQTNGLIWMGEINYMQQQITEKLEKGFNCLKLKIGSLKNDAELDLIDEIRKKYNASFLTIRVDANGAYSPEEAKSIIDKLALLQVHSIEQPIKAGQYKEMAKLCNSSPIPIALDEELIGISSINEKVEMLNEIKPQFLILKPGLLGGFSVSDEWISIAEKIGSYWWATSALESNIGLNAIAQWVSDHDISLHQGLGTGMLYSNNIDSPLTLIKDKLYYDVNKIWNISHIGEI